MLRSFLAASSLLIGLWAANPATASTGIVDRVKAIIAAVSAPKSDCEIDPDFFYDGSIVSARDLQYIQERSMRALSNPKSQGDLTSLARTKRTIEIIDKFRAKYPQTTLCQCRLNSDTLVLTPYDWKAPDEAASRYVSDVVVIGGELPSLTTAMEASEHGYKVTVVYAGPLGGICADTGANLRFFDCESPTSHPESQVKLFADALGITNRDQHEVLLVEHSLSLKRCVLPSSDVSLPTGMDAILAAYFAKHYRDTITFVKTHSYDSLNVQLDGNRLTHIATAEGAQVSGQYFIDTDPDSRVAEKCGVPMDINTPDLCNGVVFGVSPLTTRDLDRLESHKRISPENLMKLTGVTLDQVRASQSAYKSYLLLRSCIADDWFSKRQECRWGYCALARGFDFKMQCEEIACPGDSKLHWLNSHRRAKGFNISIYGDNCAFNSVDYFFPKTILQYSPGMANDANFDAIRTIDMPALQDYFRYASGNPALTLWAPTELYVRKSTAFFKILHPYQRSEFNHNPSTKYYTYYPMDLRGLRVRDMYGWTIVSGYMDTCRGRHLWGCRASATETTVGNLFLINKDAVTPAFSGGQRILGNQINMGAALIDALPRTIERAGGHPQFVRVAGAVAGVDKGARGFVLAARQVTVEDSASIHLDPPHIKHIVATGNSLWNEPHVGDSVMIDGWDHGPGTRLWAVRIQPESR